MKSLSSQQSNAPAALLATLEASQPRKHVGYLRVPATSDLDIWGYGTASLHTEPAEKPGARELTSASAPPRLPLSDRSSSPAPEAKGLPAASLFVGAQPEGELWEGREREGRSEGRGPGGIKETAAGREEAQPGVEQNGSSVGSDVGRGNLAQQGIKQTASGGASNPGGATLARQGDGKNASARTSDPGGAKLKQVPELCDAAWRVNTRPGKKTAWRERVAAAMRESGLAAWTTLVDHTLVALFTSFRIDHLMRWLRPRLKRDYARITGVIVLPTPSPPSFSDCLGLTYG
jgi:hypothetical protein